MLTNVNILCQIKTWLISICRPPGRLMLYMQETKQKDTVDRLYTGEKHRQPWHLGINNKHES